MDKYEIAVIGGGLVGAAIAFGLRDLGPRIALFDEGDVAHRAARGNFGLIWVQGKGLGMPSYGAWTQRSAREWPRLASQLLRATGIDVALRQGGGLHVCLSQDELDVRERRMNTLASQAGFPECAVDVLDRAGVAAKLGAVGPQVAGGTFCELDGECNPLRLLRALHAGFAEAGGIARFDRAVTHVEPAGQGFVVHTAGGPLACERVVLAAGLANARLAPTLGLHAPVVPNKGQVIALERVRPFLSMPLGTLRQTDEGTVLIGDAQQDLGLDETLDTGVLAAMAQRAAHVFPFLRAARVMRAWAALRVMSPDGFPIYAQSRAHPGAWVATCHSGVTLAAVHAAALAQAIREGALPAECSAFGAERFDVRAAA
ncbi:MAG TPA: FAD-dependent oxidoreductase [Casimicrobiaceae bacterium]|nr:FAD-dependent oxidoreductase [Casimicrobiaceae bacterium]